MAAKPLTSEAIAITEKKMDMTLDDIIKLSKKSTSKVKKPRASNKSQKFLNGNAAQGNSLKMRRLMDARSSLRQGALAQRRSNFQGNQFPLATEVARKAASVPIRNRPLNQHNRVVNWNKPRVGAPPVQRRTEGGFTGKRQQQHVKVVVPKQRPQTLDSMFANMKEQRMRVQSQQQQQNNARGIGAQQRQWGRGGRFGNFAN